MKKLLAVVLAVVMLATTGGAVLAFDNWKNVGHDGLNGPHYTLNILGKDKNMEIDGCGDGHRIFVSLGSQAVAKKTKIMLSEGPFAVLDCDGTDGRAAFQLPDPEGDSMCTAYSVYVRALGKPNGSATINTCANVCREIDVGSGDCVEWVYLCSSEIVELERTRGGKSKFVNVSKELLTLCVEVCTSYNATGGCETIEYKRVYLFDDELEGELWEYDNKGLRHAQLRFYERPSCYTAEEWECPAK